MTRTTDFGSNVKSLCLNLAEIQAMPGGGGQVTYSASDGDKKARSPGSAKETVKTIACGDAG
jgi:hypothetical protein